MKKFVLAAALAFPLAGLAPQQAMADFCIGFNVWLECSPHTGWGAGKGWGGKKGWKGKGAKGKGADCADPFLDPSFGGLTYDAAGAAVAGEMPVAVSGAPGAVTSGIPMSYPDAAPFGPGTPAASFDPYGGAYPAYPTSWGQTPGAYPAGWGQGGYPTSGFGFGR